MIISDRKEIDNKQILILSSIGGSPIHEGHCRLIKDCKPKVLADLHSTGATHLTLDHLRLLIIVNCDDFLIRKHQFSFQSEDSRAEILDSIQGVDYTFVHQSDKQTIEDALYYFQPHYFCKGGDRSSRENLPRIELDAVDGMGIKLLLSCGGSDKVSSSSNLMKRCANHYLFNKPADDWVEDIDLLCQGAFPFFQSSIA